MDGAGFYGKLPSHGDFVSRRLPRSFLDVWDHWLQQSVAESKARLGSAWLDAYLNSPIWRFALMPGICGDRAHLGLMMPSIDRVGRYFPLTVAAPLQPGVSALGSAIAAGSWFDHIEELLLGVLGEQPTTLEEFNNGVEVFSSELTPAGRLSLPTNAETASMQSQWQLSAPIGASAGLSICSLVGGVVLDEIGPLSVWWTRAGEDLPAKYLATLGLPSPADYAGMLAAVSPVVPNNWQDAEENPRAVLESQPEADAADLLEPVTVPRGTPESHRGDTLSLEALINSPVSLAFESAARTVAGKVRVQNEDAVLERPEQALWVVADGMGGHSGGSTASASVIAAVDLADLPESIDNRISALSRALQSANRQIIAFAQHRSGCDGMGSTVALVTAAEGTAGIVWAGDTRVYRKRGSQFDQLTIDHSERQERIERGDISSILGSDANVVTRAVGGENVLQLSIAKQAIHPGDRFLICSDGVYSELSAFQLTELMMGSDCGSICDSIVDAVLEGRARDNASVICIEAKGA